jgi:hypothetical protein
MVSRIDVWISYITTNSYGFAADVSTSSVFTRLIALSVVGLDHRSIKAAVDIIRADDNCCAVVCVVLLFKLVCG